MRLDQLAIVWKNNVFTHDRVDDISSPTRIADDRELKLPVTKV